MHGSHAAFFFQGLAHEVDLFLITHVAAVIGIPAFSCISLFVEGSDVLLIAQAKLAGKGGLADTARCGALGSCIWLPESAMWAL